jgi:hypothetical protein
LPLITASWMRFCASISSAGLPPTGRAVEHSLLLREDDVRAGHAWRAQDSDRAIRLSFDAAVNATVPPSLWPIDSDPLGIDVFPALQHLDRRPHVFDVVQQAGRFARPPL